MPLVGFESKRLPRILFGAGKRSELGKVAAEFGHRPLIVTDAGILSAGYIDAAIANLESLGLTPAVYSDVQENPTGAICNAVAEAAREHRADLLIGFGGGSSLDAAKGGNFVLTNGGRIQDYWGTGKATQPMLPLIAVPTTAGTGSEMQSYALISDDETHAKMACGDAKAMAQAAILDPELTLSMPPAVTANTGIDALAHAIESYVSKPATVHSRLFAREAFRLIIDNLTVVFAAPNNLDARAQVQLGACYAGAAIEASMLGCAHAAANPLTATFGIAHGEAVGRMLPHVLHRNWQDPAVAHAYADLAQLSESCRRKDAEGLARVLDELVETLHLRRESPEISRAKAQDLAKDASGQWTGTFNPVPYTADDFIAIYAAEFGFSH